MKSNYHWLRAISVAIIAVYIIDLNISGSRVAKNVPVLKYSIAGLIAILFILAVQVLIDKRRKKNQSDDHGNQE